MAAGRARASAQRISALDFTKGLLVVSMVVYHTINRFHNEAEWTRYLRFVPPSFIFAH